MKILMNPVGTRLGMFYLVIGASGAGKDTLIHGARECLGPSCRTHVFARRVITRPLSPTGEQHLPVSDERFEVLTKRGALLIDWAAHGCRYGLPLALMADLFAGRHVIANGSRAMVRQLAQRVPQLTVVQIEARPELLAARLAQRGRESAESVALRLARQVQPDVPDGVRWIHVRNEGTVDEGVQAFMQAIDGHLASGSASVNGLADRAMRPLQVAIAQPADADESAATHLQAA